MTKEERINKLLEWMKTATKSERHIPEIEEFAKNNPKIFARNKSRISVMGKGCYSYRSTRNFIFNYILSYYLGRLTKRNSSSF